MLVLLFEIRPELVIVPPKLVVPFLALLKSWVVTATPCIRRPTPPDSEPALAMLPENCVPLTTMPPPTEALPASVMPPVRSPSSTMAPVTVPALVSTMPFVLILPAFVIDPLTTPVTWIPVIVVPAGLVQPELGGGIVVGHAAKAAARRRRSRVRQANSTPARRQARTKPPPA